MQGEQSIAVPRLLRSWFPHAPAERLGVLRILVGLYATVYLIVRVRYILGFAARPAGQFTPVGILAWMSEPMEPGLYRVMAIGAILMGALFTLGWSYRWIAPVFATLLWIVLTYANSWGTVLHTDNLLVLHVLVLACSRAADAVSLDARDAKASVPSNEAHPTAAPPKTNAPAEGIQYGWPIRLMCWVCVLAYFMAGVAKLRNGGLEFVSGVSLRNYIAMAAVRKIELGSVASPVAQFVLPYPSAFQGLAIVSLVLELCAPVAMLHRRLGVWWSFGAWGFHFGILVFMAIGFFYPLTFVAFAPFFRVERLAEAVRRRRAST